MLPRLASNSWTQDPHSLPLPTSWHYIATPPYPAQISPIKTELFPPNPTQFVEAEETLIYAGKYRMVNTALLRWEEDSRMKKAVPLINAIDTGRFPRLLSRILQKLHLKAESSFSEEEEEKLQAAFSLKKQELHLVLETISFVLEQLETVGWQLNLQMAHSTQAKLQSPQAVLQLGVSQEDSKNLEKVLVEFNHKELFDFYNKLETIQAQLDSLS
ncbi:COMM domain-containing protein 10 isoform X2 [Arvicola amphibius]|uniref:COMM domain-containing protein 10 isoform X2 n=1 Tax=Arvicola amphibius TaxID=1047088 RepID=UPI0018E360AF|nr:COMM domain-containing protein 10 isoform X2 [Arvicola amphibius]